MGRYLDMLAVSPAKGTGARLTKETKETKEVTLNSLNSFISYPDVLTKAAAEACASLSGYITPSVLLSKLAPEDLAELEAMPTDSAVRFLRAFATACVWTDMRRQGIAPPGWDQPATCKLCGPVYLWAPIQVAGCPWCWNRVHGIKIPRPPQGNEN